MTIDLVIVDDQPLARAGLRMILDGQPDLRIVGETVGVLLTGSGVEGHQADDPLAADPAPDDPRPDGPGQA